MRKLSAWLVMISIAIPSYACDICGCASGAGYIGLLPKFQRSFIGVRYQYQQFYSKPHDMQNEQNATSRESFSNTEIWGRFVPHKRIQLFGFFPYRFSQRSEDKQTLQTSGIGDIQFIANYVVYNTSGSSSSKWRQSLQLGAGIKFPTGKYDLVKDGLFIHQNMQIGTGSYDIPVNLIYTIRRKNIGMNAEINDRFNGENKFGYSFGNKLNASVHFLRWIELKKLTCLPQIGFNIEHAGVDHQHKEQVDYTGGDAMLAAIGCDVYHRKIAFGLHLSQPVYQQIGEGYTQGKTRLSANIIYLFNKKN